MGTLASWWSVLAGLHTGDKLMIALIGVYMLIALAFFLEGQWVKTWYWIAAAQIVVAVLLMK
jgi:drug/metabolite transporter (DMT)-like permease